MSVVINWKTKKYDKNNFEAALRLSECAELTASWKDTLNTRYETKKNKSTEKRLIQENI